MEQTTWQRPDIVHVAHPQGTAQPSERDAENRCGPALPADSQEEILGAALIDHYAPARPLTVCRAHQEMQAHRACGRDLCPRKAAAFQVLVSEGRIVPDSSRL
ncbi:hypothetical protein [Nocardia nova]|uniref:hypothetical protein n=1 Tax=Nocardia nova TaxID=37330 RepID=UPI003410B44C